MLARKYHWVIIATLFIYMSFGEVLTAKGQGPLNKPQLQARVNKTAIWVGDQLEYKIAVRHNRDIELVTENLSKEGIKLEPFKILDGKIETKELSTKSQLTTITFLLTCYEIGKGAINIPSWNIYYTHRSSPLQKSKTQVEYITVPAMSIGLGSTLTENTSSIRDFKPIGELGLMDRLIPLIGVIGLVMLMVVGTKEAVIRFKAGIAGQEKISRQFMGKRLISALDEIKGTSFRTPEEIIQSYAQLNQILYEFINYWTGSDMSGLTPEEVNAELIGQGNDEKQAQRIRALLDRCQIIRYYPYNQTNDKGDIDNDIEETRGIILNVFQQ